MDEVKVTFTIKNDDTDISFESFEEISDPTVLKQLKEKFATWSKQVRKAAAEHLVKEQLGDEKAKQITIGFEK
ncbi:hypothetical protein [Desulfuribacillus alkaliarsenatis]|uniref:Uncharacterized protein n=1 Tax=Desulfuribacillus alkaliarsenatis TaxID=766136 RepID=A0A1E5G3W1_9FIRM|nr:hypothetical protein [Desulfuribacillus alkaliarsenatis]OEF97773.1 hypothetical protein BHF68_13875 [Desulfuribacillus alkaliarsenatis]